MPISTSIKTLSFFAVTIAVSTALATPAMAREQIRAVGSSTVYPFITTAAEQFGQEGKFKTPIVESTGTGGGFKLFCEGVGADFPDINDASREMTEAEKDTCKKNGVGQITELAIGYDGIALTTNKQSPFANLSRQDIFLALARQVPQDGKLVANPYNSWKQVNAALPDQPIAVYGPPPTSGTRDAFVELAMEAVCKDMPEFKTAIADEKERGKACKMIREDGKYIEAGEDDNLIIQKLKTNPAAIGILGYSYLEENKAAAKGLTVDNVTPAFDSISNGSYKLSRKLYIYVKNDHIGKIPGLAEFAKEATSENALGANGYMARKGLIPLHDEERSKMHAVANALK